MRITRTQIRRRKRVRAVLVAALLETLLIVMLGGILDFWRLP